MTKFVIMLDWLNSFEYASEEEKKEIFYRIIEYGAMGREVEDPEDWRLRNIWNNIKGNIRRMQDKYEEKQEFGKTHGRKATVEEEVIFEYLKEHPKTTVPEMGRALGLPEGEAKKKFSYIYYMKAWEKRKFIEPDMTLDDFYAKIGKNSAKGIPIPEKNSENAENLNTFPEKQISPPNFFDDRF